MTGMRGCLHHSSNTSYTQNREKQDMNVTFSKCFYAFICCKVAPYKIIQGFPLGKKCFLCDQMAYPLDG